jgi:hypothetical protein
MSRLSIDEPIRSVALVSHFAYKPNLQLRYNNKQSTFGLARHTTFYSSGGTEATCIVLIQFESLLYVLRKSFPFDRPGVLE